MTFALAAGYVVATALVAFGFGLRRDPRVAGRLAERASPRSSILERVGARLRLPATRAVVVERLGPGAATSEVDRAVGAKVVSAAGGMLVGALVAVVSVPLGGVLGLLLGLGGSALPGFALARRVKDRGANLEAAVPDLLDAIAICVSAGLTPRRALERATTVVGEPLAGRLERAADHVRLGGSWRESLAETARGSRDLHRLAVTLDRGTRLGAPVADRLRHLAREAREERRAADEERARRAPVLMLFPLVFLILPAFVLAAVLPAVLVATRGVQ